MHRRTLPLSLAFILLGASAFNPKTPPDERNAVLISWDGALREHVRRDLARGKLPSTARLTRSGALVDIEVTGHLTDTKAGHAEMLTGYGPHVTGVYSNAHFRPIPRGYSIFERLHQAFGKQAIATIMLAAKDHNLGSLGPTSVGPGEPFFLVRPDITVWDGDKIRSARAVGERATHLIRTYARKRRFFLFIHFADVDFNGHRHREDSQAYDQALVDCDFWLGKIMDEIETQGIERRTLVYVTADHGFDVGTNHHAGATHIVLATNDPTVTRNGEQRDITPTVLQAMGVDLVKIEPPLPGRPLGK
jgi:predicted AlkP superfamily pyrophosphatase or phosphodiesterase